MSFSFGLQDIWSVGVWIWGLSCAMNNKSTDSLLVRFVNIADITIKKVIEVNEIILR